MAEKIFLGIDLGTTVLKLCAFDVRKGRVLAQSSRRLPIRSLPDGGREISLRSIDRAFQSIVQELNIELGARWRAIAGIGLASQAGSTIIAHRETGNALTPMIPWNDGRTHGYNQRLMERKPKNFWSKAILNDCPPAGLGRLQWLKEHRPELFHADRIHIGAGEYLFFQLTGVWRQDSGNALQIGSYNAVTKSLFSDLFKLIGIPLSFVAPLRKRHETVPLTGRAGKRFGLPEGIPVAGPYFDQEASYLSASGTSTQLLQVSLGTAWVGNFILPSQRRGASPTQLVVDSPLDDGRLVVQPLLTGNPSWEWGLKQFVNNNLANALPKAELIFRDSPLPPPGLCAIPWFTQSNPFQSSTYGGGTITGLHDRTGKADLLRAVAAGMVFELGRVFLDVKNAQLIDCIVLGGGASKGDHFCQRIASLFSPIPVFRQVDEDLAAARGSVYAFQKEIARSRLERIKVSESPIYDELQNRFQEYCTVFNQLYGSLPYAKAYQVK